MGWRSKRGRLLHEDARLRVVTRVVTGATCLLTAGCVGATETAPAAALPEIVPNAVAVCGDGVVTGAEACDDGNFDDFDACARDCTLTEPFEGLVTRIERLMAEYDIGVGALAVTYRERLVLARGFGVLDSGEPVAPTARFRIASVSKFITSLAVHALVEDGALDLDTALLDVLSIEIPESDFDERWYQITVRDLLRHSGGWDRELTFDPTVADAMIAEALNESPPATPQMVLRYMLTQPLDFEPGSRHAYSNFGFQLLRMVVEAASGESYADVVQARVFDPAGVDAIAPSRTRRADRLPGEVLYEADPGQGLVTSVFPDESEPVPEPYGAVYMEGRTAGGGWVASAVDLCRVLVYNDGFDGVPDTLQPQTLAGLTARPGYSDAAHEPTYYASGLQVRVLQDGGQNWWHTGSLPGTAAIVVRTGGHMTWTALFNRRRRDLGDFHQALDSALWEGVRSVDSWPTHDVFDHYAGM